jgi:hypothetical protein
MRDTPVGRVERSFPWAFDLHAGCPPRLSHDLRHRSPIHRRPRLPCLARRPFPRQKDSLPKLFSRLRACNARNIYSPRKNVSKGGHIALRTRSSGSAHADRSIAGAKMGRNNFTLKLSVTVVLSVLPSSLLGPVVGRTSLGAAF